MQSAAAGVDLPAFDEIDSKEVCGYVERTISLPAGALPIHNLHGLTANTTNGHVFFDLDQW